MANKLFLVSATLAFFFLLTNASIYRTVVEFKENDATIPNGPFGPIQECQDEFEEAQQLKDCQKWIHKQATESGGGPSWALNPQGPEQRPQQLKQCCDELEKVESDCVCPTLKQAGREVRDQIRQAQWLPPRVASRIFETAQNLPNVCQIPEIGVCPFRDEYPYYPPYYG